MVGTTPPAEPRDLSEAQRRELRRILLRELRQACEDAAAAGVSQTELRELLDERLRALTSDGPEPGTTEPQPDNP